MSQISGILESISTKQTSTGKTNTGLKVGGVWYSTLASVSASKGDYVTFNWKDNKGFKNIDGAVSVSTPPADAKPSYSAPKRDDGVQNMIVAQNALTNATNLAIAQMGKGDLKLTTANVTEYILGIAEVFAKKVVSGDFYKEDKFEEPVVEEAFEDDEVAF